MNLTERMNMNQIRIMSRKVLWLALLWLPLLAHANYAFVQDAQNSSASLATTIVAPSLTVAGGDGLVVAVVITGGSAPTLSDGGVGNTYTSLCHTAVALSTFTTYFFYAQSAHAGATVITATTPGANANAIYVAEYSGIAAYITGSCITNLQNGTGGNGANVLTSTVANVTSQPAMLFGLTTDFQSAATGNLTAGTIPTAFAGHSLFWANVSLVGSNTSLSEDVRVTTTGNVAATFGTNQQFDSFTTSVLAIAEGSGGGTCTHAGRTSAGGSAVPNGSTGSYWGKTGAFVTPDCSTINYWQPAVGNFGVN